MKRFAKPWAITLAVRRLTPPTASRLQSQDAVVRGGVSLTGEGEITGNVRFSVESECEFVFWLSLFVSASCVAVIRNWTQRVLHPLHQSVLSPVVESKESPPQLGLLAPLRVTSLDPFHSPFYIITVHQQSQICGIFLCNNKEKPLQACRTPSGLNHWHEKRRTKQGGDLGSTKWSQFSRHLSTDIGWFHHSGTKRL